MVMNFKNAWTDLGIEYDIFFRTTDEFHIKAVQKCLQELWDKGDIYADDYEGWYSVSEEIFYTEKDLVDGKSPTGREVIQIREKNYFFRMSKYQQALIEHIQTNPDFILPEHRKNEVLGFLRQPLNDLCISRPKSRLQWGIEIPFDKDYVTYVWFDALLNYATGVGYQQPDRQPEFETWWMQTGPLHLLGKDILTTHAVYWPTMLMALGVRLPKQLFAHGWILNRDNAKMSKSFGDVLNPLELKKLVGLDQLRYFLAREIHLGNDAPFSMELLANRINTELANNLGNLLSRTSNLIEKFFAGKLPARGPRGEGDDTARGLQQTAEGLATLVEKEVRNLRPSYAIEHIVNLLTLTNRYLEERAPWKLAKTDLAAAGDVLLNGLEVLRISAILLSPVMPWKMTELLNRISCQDRSLECAKTFVRLKEGTPIQKGEPLFPRFEIGQ
jgi:methionyl-tRNA synthetase